MDRTSELHALDDRATMKAEDTSGFVAVRGKSGKLLGYYNPDTHQWKYEDHHRVEIVDLIRYRGRAS
jgi:hypothetical protein